MKEFSNSRGHVRWYWAVGLFCVAAIAFHRLFGAGFLVGILLAAGNSFLLARCYRFFIEYKKIFLMFIMYGVRYCVVGLVFYGAYKKNTIFFYGIIAGFALMHIIILCAQAFSLKPK